MTPRTSRALARIVSLLPGRSDLTEMRRDPRRNLLAGLTVAIGALPLALGFGVPSGPGAQAGLATAVVAGALAALFGGSNLRVSGPTGAMTVVLVPIVGRYGPGGVLTFGLMAGVILVALAVLRAGTYMQYVPAPVEAIRGARKHLEHAGVLSAAAVTKPSKNRRTIEETVR